MISLNWDINFEKVILKRNPTVPMTNYYGEGIFNLLPSDQKREPYNPLVNILKPHGSLNWLIPTGAQGGYGRSLEISKENPPEAHPGSHLRILDRMPVEFGPEYQCFLIPPVPDKAAVKEFSRLFWRIKEAIWNDISAKIREYAITSRTLVIIGYSFPFEDEHIKNLFVANNLFKNVWVLDTSEEVSKRIERYFPEAKTVFKKDGFAEIRNWPYVGEGFKPSRSE